jgi:hypothetical protein
MKLARHFNPAFLHYLGELLLGVLIFALALEMLAVARAKVRDLAGRQRWKGILYLAIPMAIAVIVLLWLILNPP